MEEVVLVNENDQQVGQMEKLKAHQLGLLHRAFSVFIFNSKGELLLQQRADGKYHSGGLWTNTCCSHPLPGESLHDAVNRKLKQEMGLTLSANHSFSFIYKATLDNDLTEHELDHVFIGYSDQPPVLNPQEAKAWKYQSLTEIKKEIGQQPEKFTAWFKLLLQHPHFSTSTIL
ncbi:MAG: isopentenyl-diphosphate Delta-isomerase [Cyclobacteriaceae bacterium]|jgi:isopentenyl-diphosphate delta-isomerase|nr:isopentenyl-diphosphate Delta-isomerase [Flammeovirgaceae bacterium]MCZ8020284.1 isopentenyl-diphosphate Delta-isomerase [Cytophagales bacterium]MCZ8327129.1 isopentenyl-diphosphate Delta-isomerase [Cyclobacteriaceae bacterium]